MEMITILLALLSGVALFLYGMSLMGDGLKKVAGNKLEKILYKLTSTPLKGVLLGAVVTAIIQSSSATSVMVVGFVNSGMMKVIQGIGIIMGANIGTSITGWILCLSYIEGSGGIATLLSTATLSALVAIVGIVFKMFIKKDIYRNVGDIMLGFAILMVGMQTMSGAVSPLKTNESFVSVLANFKNPFVGILIGIVFTAILQSASASVGILQALSTTGVITFAGAFPITLGIGVGAAAPVLLSAIGSSKNGKRTAFVYLFNDLFGMVFWGVVFYAVNFIVGGFGFLDMKMEPVTIAMLNTVFRVATVIMLFPFIRYIEHLTKRLIKDSPEDQEDQADFDLLEERFLAYADLAINQSHRAMNGMAKKARKNILRAMDLMDSYSDEGYTRVQEKENIIDKYEDKLGTYLMQLTGRQLSPVQTRQVSKFLYTISDFERLGDHAVNISAVAKEMNEEKIHFSEEAVYELAALFASIREIVDLTVRAFTEDDLEVAARVEPLRELIQNLCKKLKGRHVSRLRKGKCEIQQGFSFNELLTNMNRIAAHCSNVAAAMIELEESDYETHEYLNSVREEKNEEYLNIYNEYALLYDINHYKEWKKQQKEAQSDRKKDAGEEKSLLERDEKSSKSAKSGKSAKSDKGGKKGKKDKNDKNDKNSKNDKNDKNDKNSKNDKNDKNDKNGHKK